MPVSATPVSGFDTVSGFWSSQAKIEGGWGLTNSDVDSNLESRTQTADPAVYQIILNEVDAIVDRLCREAGYARPATPSDSEDYGIISVHATAMARARLNRRRGDGYTAGQTVPPFARIEKEAQDAIVDILANGVDFPARPPEADGDDEYATAPVGLRLTVDPDGRPLGVAATRWEPYWDANLETWR